MVKIGDFGISKVLSSKSKAYTVRTYIYILFITDAMESLSSVINSDLIDPFQDETLSHLKLEYFKHPVLYLAVYSKKIARIFCIYCVQGNICLWVFFFAPFALVSLRLGIFNFFFKQLC